MRMIDFSNNCRNKLIYIANTNYSIEIKFFKYFFSIEEYNYFFLSSMKINK